MLIQPNVCRDALAAGRIVVPEALWPAAHFELNCRPELRFACSGLLTDLFLYDGLPVRLHFQVCSSFIECIMCQQNPSHLTATQDESTLGTDLCSIPHGSDYSQYTR